MFKKILGLAICIASVASLATPSYAAADTAWKTEVLRGLGVYQENPVTYDNFIGSLAGFLYDDAAEMGGAEEIARSTGMIENDEAYSGNDGLTVKEACELAVITLGYKPAMGENGNYMSKAAELGIADGISGNGDDRLKADVAVEILYNMLEAEPLIKTLSGKQETQYAVAYDENLLSINRDIRKVKGLVTGTEITAIYGNSYLAQKDCIAIDNVSYYAGTNNFDALLGKNVVAYIQESDDLYDKALYVTEAKGKNETVIIDCDDITYIGNSISYIKYEADTKIKKIDIVASPRVIYNGKFLEDYAEEDFRHGTLEIIDNNNDGKYDVIKVSAYQTIVVEAIDTQERIIRNRYTFNDRIPKLQLSDMKNDNIVFRIFDSTGNETDFSAIKTDDVLSVLKSRDEKLIEIYISGNGYIEGEVTGTDNTEDIVRIDGDEYKKSEDFNKHLSKKGKTIQLGNTYIFYIDYFGKIAYIKEDAYSDYNVLVKVVINEETDEYHIVHMDMSGEWYKPAGDFYSNKLLAMPLGRTRIMGIQLYKNDIRGFLHWGYNFYYSGGSKKVINPFEDTDADEHFPAGDAFCVYPGKNGALESLRSEAFYQGLQDNRACRLLESMIGRDETVKIIDKWVYITLKDYLRSNDGILAIRDRINLKLAEVLS